MPSSPRAAAIYGEVAQRFGADGHAQTNLFYWLLRMQRVAPSLSVDSEPGHILDTSVLQGSRHAAISAAVDEW